MKIDVLPIMPNEILSSWLIRNSIVQGSDPIGWVYGIWGDWRVWTRDIDRYLPEEKAGQLKSATYTHIYMIKNMTLSPIIENIFGELPDTKKAWTWVIPTGQRNRTRTNGMYFCPECLDEKLPYFPKQWRLSWSTTCLKHRKILQLNCPKCNSVFSPHLMEYRKAHIHLCPTCGFDLRRINTPFIDYDILIFQLYLDAISQDYKDNIIFQICPNSMDTVSFFQLLRDLLTLPRMIQKNKEKYIAWASIISPDTPPLFITRKAGLTFDALTIKERQYLLFIAEILLRVSPDDFMRSLEMAGITYSMVSDKNYPSSPYLKSLFSRLPKKKVHTRRKLIRGTDIKPLSQEEMEDRMDKIRKFL